MEKRGRNGEEYTERESEMNDIGRNREIERRERKGWREEE